jgi:hypothetical protein
MARASSGLINRASNRSINVKEMYMPLQKTTINHETLNLYRKKMQAMSDDEVRELAANAMYHLQVVSGSRNSFDREKLKACGNMVSIARTPEVEAAQHEAAVFLRNHGL